MGRVRVRQLVTTVDAMEGTEAWVEDGPVVDGMVAGGYWGVVESVASVAAGKTSKRRGGEAGGDGVDQVEPAGDDGGAEPVRVS